MRAHKAETNPFAPLKPVQSDEDLRNYAISLAYRMQLIAWGYETLCQEGIAEEAFERAEVGRELMGLLACAARNLELISEAVAYGSYHRDIQEGRRQPPPAAR